MTGSWAAIVQAGPIAGVTGRQSLVVTELASGRGYRFLKHIPVHYHFALWIFTQLFCPHHVPLQALLRSGHFPWRLSFQYPPLISSRHFIREEAVGWVQLKATESAIPLQGRGAPPHPGLPAGFCSHQRLHSRSRGTRIAIKYWDPR